MADFIERERTGSAQAVEDMAATVRACWAAACRHDRIKPDSPLVVFSSDNPIVPFYESAYRQYAEMIAAFVALGYVGLSTRSREVYKRKRGKRA